LNGHAWPADGGVCSTVANGTRNSHSQPESVRRAHNPRPRPSRTACPTADRCGRRRSCRENSNTGRRASARARGVIVQSDLSLSSRPKPVPPTFPPAAGGTASPRTAPRGPSRHTRWWTAGTGRAANMSRKPLSRARRPFLRVHRTPSTTGEADQEPARPGSADPRGVWTREPSTGSPVLLDHIRRAVERTREAAEREGGHDARPGGDAATRSQAAASNVRFMVACLPRCSRFPSDRGEALSHGGPARTGGGDGTPPDSPEYRERYVRGGRPSAIGNKIPFQRIAQKRGRIEPRGTSAGETELSLRPHRVRDSQVVDDDLGRACCISKSAPAAACPASRHGSLRTRGRRRVSPASGWRRPGRSTRWRRRGPTPPRRGETRWLVGQRRRKEFASTGFRPRRGPAARPMSRSPGPR